MPGSSGGWPTRSMITSSTSTSVGLRGPRWPEPARPQGLPERGDLALEILAGEGVGAHDRGLADAQFADVALLDLGPDPQRGEVADHDQRVLGRGRRGLAGLGIDLQDRAGRGSPDAGALQRRVGCGEIRTSRGQRDFGPGRRGQPVGGERLAQIGARLIEPLLGLVDAHRAPFRRRLPGRCGAPCRRDRTRPGSARVAARHWPPHPRWIGDPEQACPRNSRRCRARACARSPPRARH